VDVGIATGHAVPTCRYSMIHCHRVWCKHAEQERKRYMQYPYSKRNIPEWFHPPYLYPQLSLYSSSFHLTQSVPSSFIFPSSYPISSRLRPTQALELCDYCEQSAHTAKICRFISRTKHCNLQSLAQATSQAGSGNEAAPAIIDLQVVTPLSFH
jgi:hypothetical protein